MTFPSYLSTKAMILGAGKGQRLLPITSATPKPLLEIKGEALLDYHLKNLALLKFEGVVVNTHYLAEKMHTHLQHQTHLQALTSFEETLLDTGGGIQRASHHFEKPFLCINADVYTTGDLPSILKDFMEAFDPVNMLVLLLLLPKAQIVGYEGAGDFFMEGSSGKPWFRGDDVTEAHLVYSGIQIINPVVFKDAQGNEPFSILETWKAHQSTLYAHIFDTKDIWFDTGTMEGLSLARGQNCKFF